MRPARIELATFGLKDRRSLEPVKVPLTTELRAHWGGTLTSGMGQGIPSVAIVRRPQPMKESGDMSASIFRWQR